MFAFTKRRLLSDRTVLAKWGEKRAQRFLKKLGLSTLARNYLCKTGELDLVMADPDGTIVFVEVKTRSSRDIAEPEDSITAAKKQSLSRAAQYFLKTHKIEDLPCRFDVVAITLDRQGKETVKHYKNAFTP
jgi:putative endonuclease